MLVCFWLINEKYAILTGGDSTEQYINTKDANLYKNLNIKLYKGYIIHLKNGVFNALIEEKKIPVNIENFTFTLVKKYALMQYLLHYMVLNRKWNDTTIF